MEREMQFPEDSDLSHPVSKIRHTDKSKEQKAQAPQAAIPALRAMCVCEGLGRLSQPQNCQLLSWPAGRPKKTLVKP
jgi:hypothetical protein